MKKKLYSSMLLLFSIFLINNSSLHAQEKNVSAEESTVKTVVNVPDENLKKQINQELGHAETADITQADMESLDEDLFLEDIENLTGLEYATNLKGLYLSGDKIEDLSPISGLTNLEAIAIGSLSDQDNHTKVKDLTPLSGLTKLEAITVVGGEVKDLAPISELTNLRVLEVPNNQIEDLSPISSLNLETLYVENNKIEDLTPISGMTNLKVLSLSNNNIEELGDLSKLSHLIFLFVDGNKIIDFSKIPNIDKRPDLGMDNTPNITNQRPEVYLNYNNIMDVPKAYKFTVKEINGKSHEFSVDLSGAKKGSNTFSLDYDAGNDYTGTMTVHLEVGDSSTIQINNPYREHYSADGYLSDKEILEYFGIKAYDKDGNDITDQIKVDSSKVNWNKAGVYDVTLSIVNPDGTFTTKVLQIEIKAGENPNKKLIQTGSTGIGFIVISLIVTLGVFFKRYSLVK